MTCTSASAPSDTSKAPVRPLALSRSGVLALHSGPAGHDRGQPVVAATVAQPAQPVLLEHAFAKRPGKRRPAQSRRGPSGPARPQLSASAVARVGLSPGAGGTALVTGATLARASSQLPLVTPSPSCRKSARPKLSVPKPVTTSPCVFSATAGASFQLEDDLPSLTGPASMSQPLCRRVSFSAA